MALVYKNEPLQAKAGMTFLDLAREVQSEYPAPIILAKLGQRLVELNKEIPDDDTLRRSGLSSPELTFLTTAERDGHKTYERGATMMFLRAVTRLFGKRVEFMKLEYATGDSL